MHMPHFNRVNDQMSPGRLHLFSFFLLALFLGHSLAQQSSQSSTAQSTTGASGGDTSKTSGSTNDAASPTNSSSSATDTTEPPTSQLAKPPSAGEQSSTVAATRAPVMAAADAGGNDEKLKAPIVARQSPPPIPNPDGAPFAPLKPESKDDMFARIDTDSDNAVTLQDYMNRDRYYVESVRTEFNDIDTNRDGKVTKGEFDSFVRRLDEQRKAAMLNASNFTLQKNDVNTDGELSVDELGAYINGTLQRSVAQLPDVFSRYDRDGNQRLNLDEFHDLDFNFPWEKFPPITDQNAGRQVFFNANGPVPPPFVNDQQLPGAPPIGGGGGGAQMRAPNGGYGSSIGPGPLPPLPQPLPIPPPARFYRQWA